MRKEMWMILALCGLMSVALSGVAATKTYCENCGISNAKDIGSEGSTYTFEIGPGGSWHTSSTLYDFAPKDYDTFVMTVTDNCTVTVKVVDCCLMGDTMALKAGRRIFRATSPDTIVVSAKLKPGTYRFYIGYIRPHTGVFPAGYDVYVSAM